MKVRLIAEIIVLAGVGANGWFWRKQLVRYLGWIFEGDQFFSLLETFLNEAAVLWFVFPFVDTLYPIGRAADTPPPHIFKVIEQTWSVALLFFILAIIAKKLADKQKNRNQERG